MYRCKIKLLNAKKYSEYVFEDKPKLSAIFELLKLETDLYFVRHVDFQLGFDFYEIRKKEIQEVPADKAVESSKGGIYPNVHINVFLPGSTFPIESINSEDRFFTVVNGCVAGSGDELKDGDTVCVFIKKPTIEIEVFSIQPCQHAKLVFTDEISYAAIEERLHKRACFYKKRFYWHCEIENKDNIVKSNAVVTVLPDNHIVVKAGFESGSSSDYIVRAGTTILDFCRDSDIVTDSRYAPFLNQIEVKYSQWLHDGDELTFGRTII